MTHILNLPSRKVFIRDLSVSARVAASLPEGPSAGQSQGKKLKEWLVTCSGKEFSLTVAWLQGTLIEVNDRDGYLWLDDGTGLAKISGHNKLPFMSYVLSKGQYVMVIGKMVSAGECPSLLAIKVQILYDQENAQRAWPIEVKDQILYASSS
ncbi:hypothetical protein FSP39_007227 [Pinctada imbricata]|uniref:RecQ-mediated genome instability protein 2 n=1 Tax=Pinctada imbricata TaxID=66713 RepID=A0AA88XQC6_PINIB|nr:hypothetical protein FSP39_007227 [Pinctada imbricata]